MGRHCRARAGALPIALALLLAACAVPIPGDRSRARDNLDDPAAATWQPGVTLLQEVLLVLGDPDDLAPDRSWLAWEDYRSPGHLLFVVGGPYWVDAFSTPDVLRYRRRYVYFDGDGRYRATHLDAGGCARPAPCAAASAPERPETLLIDAAVQPLLVAGEKIHERLLGALRAADGRWVPGAVVVTSKAMIFVDRADAWPLHRPALRIDHAGLGVVERLELPGGEGGVASLARPDGSRESIAFKPRPFAAPLDAPPFDPTRAQVLLDAIRSLRP